MHGIVKINHTHTDNLLLIRFSRQIIIVMIGLIFLTGMGDETVVNASGSLVSDNPHNVEVILQTYYLDGEMSEEEIEETIWSMEDFWSFYDDWELVNQNQQQIVFQKKVDDISPLLKMHGYFGLSEDGTLSIFNGKPEKQKVIHSFFQINTQQLKSQSHNLLLEGIPISSKDEYIEVLKNYRKYAING
ncbi:BofC C-terminal domain-containing protein [Salipaludibacillus daqingensis]|uniref:BofC C-terminal domain-containing protein n=1 Tax=Salipaludibacillus daqingensis TaxID=3041001 RepID=UPI002474D086|nr:BofC C-terminal domain-containing protein [Salipaludibacillus daqingensis]